MTTRQLGVALTLTLSAVALPSIADETALEEITVTAQKREQTLEQVPISVAVVSGDALTRQSITNIGELAGVVPNLYVAQTPFQPIVSIRGVGSGGGDRTFEQSVSTYVDGIYEGRANQFLNPFFDVERLEVVRGPQGVLFGVNAVAGGINITNRQPGDKLEGYVSTGYEFYDKSYHVDAAITLPIDDKLSFRLAATKGNDGPYIKNDVPGGQKNETGYDLVRGILRWQATDELSVKFSAESSERSMEGSPFQMYALGTNTLPVYGYAINTALENGKLDFYRSSMTPEYTDIRSNNFNLDVSWDVAGQTLTSVTGYSRYQYGQAVSSAAIPIDLGVANAIEEFNQTYEELRIASAPGKLFDYIAGVVFYRQHDDLYQGIDLAVPAGPVGFRNGLAEETRTYAAFGQLTYNITTDFRAVAGARYSDVRKTGLYTLGATTFGAPLNGYTFSPSAATAIAGFAPLGWLQYLDPADPAPSVTNHVLELRKVDPSFSLQWDANDEIHPYATFSKATKAGGFDDQEKSGIVPLAYAPETATNFEVGSKLNYHLVHINSDVFFTKYKDLQVTVPTGNNVETANAASITSKGLEIDGLVAATQQIKVGTNLTYLDARYDNFPGSGCIVPLDVIAAVTSTCVAADTNARGAEIEFAPHFTGSINVDAGYPITESVNWSWGGRAYYSAGYQLAANQDPIDHQGGYATYDAYLGVGGSSDRWNVKLYGKNLSNKVILLFGGYAGLGAGHEGVVERGRELFLTTTWNF